jgi:hypothetical protein
MASVAVSEGHVFVVTNYMLQILSLQFILYWFYKFLAWTESEASELTTSLQSYICSPF